MIYALKSRSKATFTQEFNYFVAISDMVTVNYFVVATFVVVTKVEFQMRTSLDLLNCLLSDEVNLRVF